MQTELGVTDDILQVARRHHPRLMIDFCIALWHDGFISLNGLSQVFDWMGTQHLN
ncbi:DUF2949 domain-containing protein [Synechococcales cyanobacterium C]|uniref:DUF2949 domain-containing protein n=1 Tax=Petrachloros mirabilis ULC683 TaxID=2781853 RepID=A0A8K2A0L8_9CYAN|nr:DUF2949 domain-containing protein [Petrachloros mirabilis ULC683]